MQTVRNRWAHIDNQEVNLDDAYRDIDTIYRFLQVITAEDEVLSNINEFRDFILTKRSSASSEVGDSQPQPENDEQDIAISAQKPDGEIYAGCIVALNSDPSKQGAVVEIEGQSADSRCKIFIDGKLQPFYVSQVHIVVTEESKNVVSLPELHSLLTCLQIRHPSLSTLYSMS